MTKKPTCQERILIVRRGIRGSIEHVSGRKRLFWSFKMERSDDKIFRWLVGGFKDSKLTKTAIFILVFRIVWKQQQCTCFANNVSSDVGNPKVKKRCHLHQMVGLGYCHSQSLFLFSGHVVDEWSTWTFTKVWSRGVFPLRQVMDLLTYKSSQHVWWKKYGRWFHQGHLEVNPGFVKMGVFYWYSQRFWGMILRYTVYIEHSVISLVSSFFEDVLNKAKTFRSCSCDAVHPLSLHHLVECELCSSLVSTAKPGFDLLVSYITPPNKKKQKRYWTDVKTQKLFGLNFRLQMAWISWNYIKSITLRATSSEHQTTTNGPTLCRALTVLSHMAIFPRVARSRSFTSCLMVLVFESLNTKDFYDVVWWWVLPLKDF